MSLSLDIGKVIVSCFCPRREVQTVVDPPRVIGVQVHNKKFVEWGDQTHKYLSKQIYREDGNVLPISTR